MHVHYKHGSEHLYDNGCSMCDAITELIGIAEGEITVPWATEESDTQEMLRLIRYIKRDGKKYCECGNPMGQDCMGDAHCDVCDPPCPCCCENNEECEHSNAVLSDDNEPETWYCPDCGENFVWSDDDES